MYGKATFIKVNQLRYDSFSQKYQGTSAQVLLVLMALFSSLLSFSPSPTCRVSLETHIQKEPTIRNSYQFPNVPSHEWQHWKVDNGSSILSGLVVKLYNIKWLKYCVMILLVAKRRVIIMITTEADNDKRLT